LSVGVPNSLVDIVHVVALTFRQTQCPSAFCLSPKQNNLLFKSMNSPLPEGAFSEIHRHLTRFRTFRFLFITAGENESGADESLKKHLQGEDCSLI
jgi:hypothetical protein